MKQGLYFSPKYDNMLVYVDESGFPFPVSESDGLPALIRHNLEAETLIRIWGPLVPVQELLVRGSQDG